MKKVCLLLILSLPLLSLQAQEKKKSAVEEAAYTKTINQRADKIVATLEVDDSVKALAVRDIIAGQYRNLNDIHTERDAKIKAIKGQAVTNKEAQAAEIKKVEDAASKDLKKLHAKYLSKLSKRLTPQQVEKVKDGMTYGVLPITYKGYQDMILTLTPEQKSQILAWLTEARELAMDAESSEKKHGWFGKYKGRINNYLSAAGYDLNKASKDWHERIKAQQAATKN